VLRRCQALPSVLGTAATSAAGDDTADRAHLHSQIVCRVAGGVYSLLVLRLRGQWQARRPCSRATQVTQRQRTMTTMDGQGQVTSRQVDELSDVDKVGLSTQLLFSIPLLRALVQAVAESVGDWNYLNVTVTSGAWVGVARRSGEAQLLVSTNNGSRTARPYPAAIDDALRGHGFRFVPEHEGYLRFLTFETDDAFDEVARLIAGTLAHAWGTAMGDHIRVELQLSLPPETSAAPGQPELAQ
jgi:hypothetical protein